MPTMDHVTLRDALQRTLIQRAGHIATPSTVADATVRTWRDMETRLTPVIGPRGVNALLGRSLQLACIACPWLEDDKFIGNAADQMASLKTRIEARETARLAEESFSFLVIFTGLLTNLIGESLTKRLLAPLWVSGSFSPEQDSAP